MWSAKTKIFLRCDNLKELKLPQFLHGYNAKPVLLRESGSIIRTDQYLELIINVKKFGLLANNTLPIVLSRMSSMILSIGFCVESREEDELPEALFAVFKSNKLSADMNNVPLWFG